ncbi:MAG: NAD(P)/FAD-dependent oxidoreductase [Rubricella sp.]
MKIAVVGSGIAGMGAAYALSEGNDVTLFERDDRFGGHANTVEAQVNGRTIAVDTGFIVYNYRNYPNLTGLFEHLGVPTKWSDMSFGMSVKGGRLEYACDDLDQIFAQRANALNPSFLRGVLQILRFNKEAPGQLERGALEGLSLGQWLEREGYGRWFRDSFLLPMGGAIWSTPTDDILDFPAESFIAFFRNHDLMTGLDPMQKWRTVDGGSREYVSRLIGKLGPRAKRNAGVSRVTRLGGRPTLHFEDGSSAQFDQVILATHGPVARQLLSDADAQEETILSKFRTSSNRAVLHSDPRLMPKRRKVWSSWNFLSGGPEADAGRPAPVTYWMNRLQTIDRDYPLFVSLNPGIEPDARLIHQEFSYDHPLFDAASFAGQKEIEVIQGRGGVWYAGAWLGYGFHEDGLRSGLRVAASLGAAPSWAKALPEPIATPLAEAAE